MRCPFCGHLEDRVIDSRAGEGGVVIRRRRECEGCARRFTTYERVEDVLPTVVKKDGRREPFDRQKLLRAARVACAKRPVSEESIVRAVDSIERWAQDSEKREVTAIELGERMMTELRMLDEVAYVRFASVYRSFRDLDEFQRELERMARERGAVGPGGPLPSTGDPPERDT
jgi:transcriptional repressor NrdR